MTKLEERIRNHKVYKYFESEDELAALLEDIQSEIDIVDEIRNRLVGNYLSVEAEYIQALEQITGVYAKLEPLFEVAAGEKENEESKFMLLKRNEVESKGTKFTKTTYEDEASAHVANLRRIRNLLEGYVNASENIKGTLQSRLKRFDHVQPKSEND
jgi:hypothetical protein